MQYKVIQNLSFCHILIDLQPLKCFPDLTPIMQVNWCFAAQKKKCFIIIHFAGNLKWKYICIYMYWNKVQNSNVYFFEELKIRNKRFGLTQRLIMYVHVHRMYNMSVNNDDPRNRTLFNLIKITLVYPLNPLWLLDSVSYRNLVLIRLENQWEEVQCTQHYIYWRTCHTRSDFYIHVPGTVNAWRR